MTRAPKIVLIVLAAVVAFVATSYIGLRIYFTPKKLASLTVSFAQKHLDRDVTVGSVSLGLGKFVIKDLAISNAPDFSSGTMLKAGEVGVRLELRPLIDRRIILNSVDVTQANFKLKKDKEDKLNTANLLVTRSEQSTSKKTGESRHPLEVQNLELEDCTFSYKDDESGLDIKIEDIALEASDISKNKPFDAQISLTFKYASPKHSFSLPVEVEGTVDPAGLDWEKAKAKVSELNIRSGNFSAEVSGDINNFKKPAGSLKMNTNESNTDELRQLIAKIPAGVFLPKMSISSKYKSGDSELIFEEVKLKSAPVTASGKTSIRWGDGARTDINIFWFGAGLDYVASFIAKLKEYGARGYVSGNMRVGLSRGAPSYSGKLKLKDVKFGDKLYAFSAINGDVDLSKKSFRLKEVSGKLNGSPFTTTLSAILSPKSTTIDANFNLATLNIKTLPDGSDKKKRPKKPKHSGTSRALNLSAKVKIGSVLHKNFSGKNANIDLNIMNFTPAMNRLNGNASFAIHDGKIRDLHEVSKDHEFLKLLLLPIMIVQDIGKILRVGIFPSLKEITYSIIEGKYTFKDGIMSIEKSDMNSSAAYVTVKGNANLPTEELDLKIKASPRGIVGLIDSPEFHVKGTISDPSVKYDPASIITSPITAPFEKGKRLIEKIFK